MQKGFQHAQQAESTLLVSVPEIQSQELLSYQIISAFGSILRKGSFKGSVIYISTRLLPKGEKYLLRICRNEQVHHEGQFVTY